MPLIVISHKIIPYIILYQNFLVQKKKKKKNSGQFFFHISIYLPENNQMQNILHEMLH